MGRVGTGRLPSPALIGLITTAGALAAALSATLVGRLAGRWRLRLLLLIGLVVGGGSSLSILLAGSHLQLLAAITLFGLMIGIVTTSALLASARLLPDGVRGVGFGLVASGGLFGRAISPAMSGTLAGFDLRWVFALDVSIYAFCMVGLMLRKNDVE